MAAERGENRVHSRSVLKFQEAEVGGACYKASFLLPLFWLLRMLTFREKFIFINSFISPFLTITAWSRYAIFFISLFLSRFCIVL